MARVPANLITAKKVSENPLEVWLIEKAIAVQKSKIFKTKRLQVGGEPASEPEPPPPPPPIEAIKLDATRKPPAYTLSENDTLAVNTSGGTDYQRFQVVESPISGDQVYYWEVLYQRTASGGANGYLGVVTEAQRNNWASVGNPISLDSIGYRGNGSIWQSSTQRITGLPSYGNGDIIMLAFNPATGGFWIGLNGVWNRNPETDTPNYSTTAGTFYPQVQGRDQGDGGRLISLASEFNYPIPSNAIALSETV